MTCPRCGSGVVNQSSFCPHCGSPLAAQSTAARCPRCRCTSIQATKRGYRFGLGILGFFLFPVVGLLLGFIGSNKLRCTCLGCGRRWYI